MVLNQDLRKKPGEDGGDERQTKEKEEMLRQLWLEEGEGGLVLDVEGSQSALRKPTEVNSTQRKDEPARQLRSLGIVEIS